MCLSYKSAIFWKMQAGMGDTIFTPLHQVLEKNAACASSSSTAWTGWSWLTSLGRGHDARRPRQPRVLLDTLART